MKGKNLTTYHDIKHTMYFNIDINNFENDELNIYSVMQYIENYVTICLSISLAFSFLTFHIYLSVVELCYIIMVNIKKKEIKKSPLCCMNVN